MPQGTLIRSGAERARVDTTRVDSTPQKGPIQLRNRRILAAPLAATGLVAALTLTGCFGNPIGDLVEQAAGEQLTEGLVEGLTGGAGDLNLGSMPSDFPSDIPIIDGKIVTGMKIKGEDGDGTMWSVMFEFTDESLIETARQKLLDAGYEESSWGNFGGLISGAYSGPKYEVQLAVFNPEGGDPGTIGYNVFERGE